MVLCLVVAGFGCDFRTGPPAGRSIVGTRADDRDAGPSGDATVPAGDAADRADQYFDDATKETGVDFAYRNGREAGRYYLIESFGGGVAAVDFDLDGDVDLFFTGGGTISSASPVRIAGLPSALFRNDGDWRFADITRISGFDCPVDYSQGCAVTDFNSDGFPDLFVCCYGRSRLYANQGDGTFAEAASAAQAPFLGWGTAAAFGDFDRDGLPDLFLAHYVDWSPEGDVECRNPEGIRDLCGPTAYAGTTCRFFHNAGDGRFDDRSEDVGLKGDVRGLGVVAADLNGDGWIDFYVASDESPKHLYLGGPELRFTENGEAAGVAVNEWGRPEGSMGIDVGDYNGDGLPDIFVTNFENEDSSLFRNLGEGLFMRATTAAGLSGHARMHVGFGTSFVDFDSDGWLDLFVLNGNPIYGIAQTPFKQVPQLFRNLEGRRFTDVSSAGGPFFREAHSGRGNAVADLDDDGAPDLVVVLMGENVHILRNRLAPKNFVRVELRARNGERDATGARVSTEYQGQQLARFAVRGAGFFSQSDPRLIFPVAGEAAAAEVTVDWPGRARETFRGLAVRRSHVLIEGRGQSAHEPD